MKTMRNHYAAIRMTKIQNTDDTRWWQGCGTTGIFILAAGKANGIPMLEDSLASFFFFFLNKMEHTLIMWPNNCVPWYLSK